MEKKLTSRLKVAKNNIFKGIKCMRTLQKSKRKNSKKRGINGGFVNITKYLMEALYVDDLLIAGSTNKVVTQLESIFEAKYKMKKINTIKQLLGMGIFHDKICNTIYYSTAIY